MSIAEIQKRKVLEGVTRALYSAGHKPRTIDIMQEVSEFFSKYSAGNPIPLNMYNLKFNDRSDVDKFNALMASSSMNLDVAYEAAHGHIDELLMLTTLLRANLENLKRKRRALSSRIDDYLLSVYNSDGYFYSVSDTFADLDGTDLVLTSAFVDIEAGELTIPGVGNLTRKVPYSSFGTPSTSAKVDDADVTVVEKHDFSGSVDGLTNTLWWSEVVLPTEKEVNFVASVPMDGSTISRIDIDPYTVSPVQVWINVAGGGQSSSQFGNGIVKDVKRMVFVNDKVKANVIELNFRKDEADYTTNNNGTLAYHYIFGAKSICATEHVYDADALFVSEPLFMPTSLNEDNTVDAVAIVVDDVIPLGSEIDYYVSGVTYDSEDALESDYTADDFDWKPIVPLGKDSQSGDRIIRLDGALFNTMNIMPDPQNAGDVQLIELDSTNVDLDKRNPTPSIIPGVDVYRIASVGDNFLKGTAVLEEGVGTTRMYSVDLNAEATTSLDFWTEIILGEQESTTQYGTIEDGRSFFYGGDVGESGRSVYVETFLESLTDRDTVIEEFAKIDSNAKQWEMRVFLNGNEVGYLPVGTDKSLIPWTFRQGTNHICALINIPDATDVYPNVYIGNVDIFSDKYLTDYGEVKLATWTYVDLFKMQYNEVGQPFTFTIVNGELVSRRKPTTNFRLRYASKTGNGPDGIRIRADLTRGVDNVNTAPSLRSYRVKFSYGGSS